MTIYDGADHIIDRAFGGRHCLPRVYQQMRPSAVDYERLLLDIFDTMESNWSADSRKSASRKNWQLRIASEISPHNESQEKIYEKRIAQLSESELVPRWFNQIPTASGLCGGGTHCNIDLVHQLSVDSYEFIELEWSRSTPLYSMMQIVKYTVCYCFSRANWMQLGYGASEQLAGADSLHLKVLAPQDFYWCRMSRSQALSDLQHGLEDGFQRFAAKNPRCGIRSVKVSFEVLPGNPVVPALISDLAELEQRVPLSESPSYHRFKITPVAGRMS